MLRPFICHKPREIISPVIFSSPHSGRLYSLNFLKQSVLCFEKIRMSEDCYVDKLLETVTDCGSVLLEACFPRAFVDVNRSSKELDKKLIRTQNDFVMTSRASIGLGVIPRVVGAGIEIYENKLLLSEVTSRLKSCYFPYHEALEDLMEQTKKIFGSAILFDFHSMPNNSVTYNRNKKDLAPQIVLSNCFGSSSHDMLIAKVFDIFVAQGFRVSINDPFSGGFITKNYGKPKNNMQVIQVEIDRSLYMSELDYKLHSGYRDLKARLQIVVQALSRVQKIEPSLRQAAE